MAYKKREKTLLQTQKAILNNFSLTTGKVSANGINYDTIEYPIGALGNEKYPHYAIYYINTTDKGKFRSIDTTELADYDLTTKTSNTGISNAARKIGNTENKTKFNFINEDDKSLDVLGGLKSAAVGAAQQFTDTAAGTITSIYRTAVVAENPKKRLKKAICLPMPQFIRANYNASYVQTEGLGGWGAVIFATLTENGTSLDALKQAVAPIVAGTMLEAGKAAAQGLANVAGPPISNVTGAILNSAPKGREIETIASQLYSKFQGSIINKRQEQLFSNMQFRTHHFTYAFVPRNEQESNVIKNIIQTFKAYMHPDLSESGGSALLLTPAEFDIEFRYGNAENDSISRIATCALVDVSVDYTQIGEFVAFEGTPNPVAITLSLMFTEMEPLTRDMIAKGY